MRPLAATFALVLVAAACSLPGLPSVCVQAAPTLSSAHAAVHVERDAGSSSAPDEAPQREDGDAPDPEPVGDDLDDDGDMLATLRAASTPEPLHAAVVVWDERIEVAVVDQASSDLIRPPIRA